MENPHPDLGMVVVIPCCDEPDVSGVLDSLTHCVRPACVTEVIVVFNHAEDAPWETRLRHQATLEQVRLRFGSWNNVSLRFYFLDHPDLPARHAGVGLARKIGMDLALARLLAVGRPDGVILSLDADCRVATDYLVALQDHFRLHPNTPGCAIHFCHPLDGLNPRQRLGIVFYELSLRYVVHGWRYCGLPNAFHTVGSAMAVRARAYQKQGGMNRRQAGEDFYFLQKIMALGHFTALSATTVFPSARISHRVPFGTGRAMAKWMTQETMDYLVWHPQVFEEPRAFFAGVEGLYAGAEEIPGTGMHFLSFLAEIGFPERLREMRANTASSGALKKRFFHWFDGFRFLKWAHWATAHGLEEVPVRDAALILLDKSQIPHSASMNIEEVLALYRQLDRT
ncbi:MAG: hypothetical protein H7839_13070 [Magnetococcus sp. YQC-5]